MLIDDIKRALRCGTPLVSVETVDSGETVRQIQEGLNGSRPLLQWDFVRGFRPLNETGAAAIKKLDIPQQQLIDGVSFDSTAGNPQAALACCQALEQRSVVVFHGANRMFAGETSSTTGVTQATFNLRDAFKRTKRMLIMIGVDFSNLPHDLTGDVVSFSEPLPSESEVRDVVLKMAKTAGVDLSDEIVDRAVDACLGLKAFTVEQEVSMSLTPEGIDLELLWSRKIKQLNETSGLQVYREGKGFDAIGGVEQAKTMCKRLMNGPARFKVVLWLDELEKTALANTGDSSGTNSDYLGTTLTEMQESEAYGLMFLGAPGCCKSQLAKAIGSECDRIVIRIDVNAMQSKYVGESGAFLRNAFKVVRAVCGEDGKALWIATSNSVHQVPDALLRRFSDTYYFAMPSAEDRKAIWPIWIDHYNLEVDPTEGMPDDHGWAGSDIAKACEKAHYLGCTLMEAAEATVPVGVTSARSIEQLEAEANGRWLSASYPGTHRLEDFDQPEGERTFDV